MPAKGLSLVLVDSAEPLDVAAFVQAGATLGISITPGATPDTYTTDDGGEIAISQLATPHPSALTMPRSPTSAKPETLQQMRGHYVIAAFGLPDEQAEADRHLATITAAVVRSSPSIAAMLGHGMFFYEADFFARMVENDPERLPTQVCVDITAAQETDGRWTLLTNGLNRYGHNEVLVVSPGHYGAAIIYVMHLAQQVAHDEMPELANLGTLAGPDDEPVTPRRTPSPIAGNPDVIRIDGTTASAPAPKKRGFFGRRR